MMEIDREKLKRRILVVCALAIIIAIILFLIWWFFFRSSPVPTVDVSVPQNTNGSVSLPTQPVEADPVVTPPRFENEASVVARNFAERYGSYSTESQFQNIVDVYPIVTTAFRAVLDATKNETAATVYYGVDTRVLNVALQELGATRATATVSTQRQRRDAELNSTISYEKLIVDLVKVGDSWLVNSAEWQ